MIVKTIILQYHLGDIANLKQYSDVHDVSSPFSIGFLNLSAIFRNEFIDQILQRCEFPSINEIKLLYKIDKVLKRRVQMGLFAQSNHFGKVLMINVGIHAKQSFQNRFRNLNKVLRKGNANFRREQRFVIQLILHPSHQVINVLGSTALDGFLHRLSVGPVILVFRSGRHDTARVFGAKFRNRSVQHVDLVEKVHSVYSDPFVEILSVRKLYGVTKVAGSKRGGSVLHQIILMGALRYILLWFESFAGTKQETHLVVRGAVKLSKLLIFFYSSSIVLSRNL